jgi:hypothetical protein
MSTAKCRHCILDRLVRPDLKAVKTGREAARTVQELCGSQVATWCQVAQPPCQITSSDAHEHCPMLGYGTQRVNDAEGVVCCSACTIKCTHGHEKACCCITNDTATPCSPGLGWRLNGIKKSVEGSWTRNMSACTTHLWQHTYGMHACTWVCTLEGKNILHVLATSCVWFDILAGVACLYMGMQAWRMGAAVYFSIDTTHRLGSRVAESLRSPLYAQQRASSGGQMQASTSA